MSLGDMSHDDLNGENGIVTAEALVTVRQLAERLDVSDRTVQRRLKAAGIGPVRTAQGVPHYAADTAERIAEPTGAGEETALAVASTSAVALALEQVRGGYEAALAAERRRADDLAAERDRVADAAAAERARLAAATDATIAELRRRAEAAEGALDAARGRIEAAEAAAAAARERQAAVPPAPPPDPPRGFWARLLG